LKNFSNSRNSNGKISEEKRKLIRRRERSSSLERMLINRAYIDEGLQMPIINKPLKDFKKD